MTLFALLVCCFLPLQARQDGNTTRPMVAKDNNCEENRSFFDHIHIEAGDEPLIIIARLGDGERSKALGWRRLHNIREYFAYIREIPNQKLIVAEGEPAEGLGRVEVFLRGRLFAVFLVGRNQDLNGGDCEGGESPRYYPWRKKTPLPVRKVSPEIPG